MENCLTRQNIPPNQIHFGPKSAGQSVYRGPGMRLDQELNMTRKKAVKGVSEDISYYFGAKGSLGGGGLCQNHVGRGKAFLAES